MILGLFFMVIVWSDTNQFITTLSSNNLCEHFQDNISQKVNPLMTTERTGMQGATLGKSGSEAASWS